MDKAQSETIVNDYTQFRQAGGILWIDGQLITTGNFSAEKFSGMDDITLATLLSDLRTFTMMMDAANLGNQELPKGSRANVKVNSGKGAVGVTWTN